MVIREVNHSYKIPLLIKACAEKHGVTLSHNTNSAEATNFENAGKFVNFINDIENTLINYGVGSFGIGSSYNPYSVRIRW